MAVISGALVATAASAVGAMLLLNLIGIVLAIYPRRDGGKEHGLLTQQSISTAATMSSRIFFPCLIGVATAQVTHLEEVWPLIFWPLVGVAAAILLTYPLSFMVRLSPIDRMPFVAACSW